MTACDADYCGPGCSCPPCACARCQDRTAKARERVRRRPTTRSFTQPAEEPLALFADTTTPGDL